jgi:hypothetical protein
MLRSRRPLPKRIYRRTNDEARLRRRPRKNQILRSRTTSTISHLLPDLSLFRRMTVTIGEVVAVEIGEIEEIEINRPMEASGVSVSKIAQGLPLVETRSTEMMNNPANGRDPTCLELLFRSCTSPQWTSRLEILIFMVWASSSHLRTLVNPLSPFCRSLRRLVGLKLYS